MDYDKDLRVEKGRTHLKSLYPYQYPIHQQVFLWRILFTQKTNHISDENIHRTTGKLQNIGQLLEVTEPSRFVG